MERQVWSIRRTAQVGARFELNSQGLWRIDGGQSDLSCHNTECSVAPVLDDRAILAWVSAAVGFVSARL